MLLRGPLVSDFPAGPFPLLLFALFSYVIGDKTILQDVGVNETKDVQALPPPYETKDKIPAHIVVCFLMAEWYFENVSRILRVL